MKNDLETVCQRFVAYGRRISHRDAVTRHRERYPERVADTLYYERHSERLAAKATRYREQHPLRAVAARERYKQRHPDRIAAKNDSDCASGRNCWKAMQRRAPQERVKSTSSNDEVEKRVGKDSYRYYGALGVKVCKRWQGPNGFKNFQHDMGLRPSLEHSLDRWPDPAGDYTPTNTRWATKKQQRDNQRKVA